MSTLRDILVPVISASVGVFATIVTGGFGYLNKDRELDIRMVDIGLSILKAETAETTEERAKSENARRFALRLLRKYADVDIPEVEFDAWAKGGNLPLATKFPSRSELIDEIGILQDRMENPRLSEEEKLRIKQRLSVLFYHLSLYTAQDKLRDAMDAVRD